MSSSKTSKDAALPMDGVDEVEALAADGGSTYVDTMGTLRDAYRDQVLTEDGEVQGAAFNEMLLEGMRALARVDAVARVVEEKAMDEFMDGFEERYREGDPFPNPSAYESLDRFLEMNEKLGKSIGLLTRYLVHTGHTVRHGCGWPDPEQVDPDEGEDAFTSPAFQ